jgi:hypothetical protein
MVIERWSSPGKETQRVIVAIVKANRGQQADRMASDDQ